MNHIYLLLSAIFFNLTLYAQTFVNYGALGPGGGGGTVKAYIKPGESSTTSNPYLFKAWNNNSMMTTQDGKTLLVPNINFDVENSMFVAKISTDSVFSFYNIDKVDVNNQSFKRYDGKFYQVLYENKNSVVMLKHFSLVEKKAVIHATTNTILKPSEFKIISKYFVILFDNALQEIKLNKKNILSVLHKNEESIMDFVKKKRLSFSKEEDVIDIIHFYATL